MKNIYTTNETFVSRDGKNISIEEAMGYAIALLRKSGMSRANQSDLDDILQEVYLRLKRFGRTYDSSQSLNAWVGRITLNLMKDNYCRNRRYADGDYLDIIRQEDTYDPESIEDFREKVRIVSECLGTLDDDRRELIEMKANGMKVSDIADSLEVTSNVVSINLHRTRKELTRLVRERGYYDTIA